MTPEPILSPLLRRLLACWQERRRDRIGPARRDIDPVDLRWILADLAIVDVVDDPPRFRFRLVGSNIEHRRDFRWQGNWLDELPAPELRARLTETYGAVVRARAPRHGFRDIVIEDQTLRSEYLVLPLSTDGDRVDALLVAARFPD